MCRDETKLITAGKGIHVLPVYEFSIKECPCLH